ncbi:DUF938 domain-containing protein [Agaribacter flavus]|uniref:DUF938 domain-containing protein n=1 Tax=Agaribacter flavus TaxID=1902781 RepID=A0ABV7FMM2_9ALTE
MDKPFSQACENNKQVILDILSIEFSQTQHVLEIGSGTGQHAVHFAPNLPHLVWQTSDQEEYHPSIQMWMNERPSDNLLPPIPMQFPDALWPKSSIDGVFSANTSHIMQKHEVQAMMTLIDANLPQDGVFCQYGPFIVDGEFSSQSNIDFHHKLLASGCGGYRDIKELIAWAPQLNLSHIHEMPANNLLLVWRKI